MVPLLSTLIDSFYSFIFCIVQVNTRKFSSPLLTPYAGGYIVHIIYHTI